MEFFTSPNRAIEIHVLKQAAADVCYDQNTCHVCTCNYVRLLLKSQLELVVLLASQLSEIQYS